jgi:hypothetical protein
MVSCTCSKRASIAFSSGETSLHVLAELVEHQHDLLDAHLVGIDPVAQCRDLGARVPHLDLQALDLLAQEFEPRLRHYISLLRGVAPTTGD